MEFRLAHHIQYKPGKDLRGIGDELIELTELAQEEGFDGVTVPEHHVTDDQYLYNEAIISHLADHVGDMQIGMSMCLLPLHNPVRIAEFGATIDILSDGQFRLGVAQGYRSKEYHAFNVDRRDALSRFVEGVQVIKRLWTEDSVTYDGKYYQFEDVSINPKPIQSPRPLIYTGASNVKSIRRAARLTDGWAASHVPFSDMKPRVEAFREAQAEHCDTEGHFELHREVFVAETTKKAERLAREPIMRKYDKYADWGQDEVIEGDEFESVWEKLKHERFIVGSPNEVIEELSRYVDAYDPDAIRIRSEWQGLEFEKVKNSVRLFSNEVMPSFE